MNDVSVDDAKIVQRLDSLASGDRAAARTNPFAIAICSGELVTADEVRVASRDAYPMGFACPKCKGGMRHYVSQNGTPFFAHAAARGNCPAWGEGPSHLCIKRGLHSVGFNCEVTDESSRYIWDAMHGDSGVVVEVVCSGLDRYRSKIAHTKASGTTCWWVLDSASPGLCSRFGSERICVAAFAASGTVVVENLFKPKVFEVFSAVGQDCLFAFYLGLVWRFVGEGRWQLLSEEHALSRAAVAEDGIKHLMVKMHIRNAQVVTENKRLGIDRKTWFDRKFRFRGDFSMTWSGDRDYVLGMVRQLIQDIDDTQCAIARVSKRHANGLPSAPVHSTTAEVLRRINERHSASTEEIQALREIAEKSRATSPLSAEAVVGSAASPLVFDAKERRDALLQTKITSSRWRGDPSSEMSRHRRRQISAANRKLLEIAAEKQSQGIPAYYLNNY